MSGEIFNDGSMLEIFRAEVETHAETLTSGLLSLERDPLETQQISEMMRGAHSIKGAARIVGVDPAVRVAHVMEDGFVAAQNGQLSLRPEQIDVLLRGVDFLNRVSAASKEANVDWIRFDGDATQLVAEITDALARAATGAPSTTASLTSNSIVAAGHAKPTSHPRPTPEMATISVSTFLDAAQAELIRQAYAAACETLTKRVVLDLAQTDDLDATGLALLAALHAVPRDEGPHVEFVNAGPDLQFVLRATGIDRSPDSGGL